jgi:hypothetical protein
MALTTGQWQVRDLVLGPGTAYEVEPGTNPFTLSVRSQGGNRAWNHGTWSGAEWANEKVVPMRVNVSGEDLSGWLSAFQALTAVFAPVGDSAEQVELRFEFAGAEYLLQGRPRLVDPDMSLLGGFSSPVRCAFVAQDPRIYSGTLSQDSTGLPVQSGGLTVPLTVPFTVDGVLAGGSLAMLNEGTTSTGLLARVDGPVPGPAVVIQQPDGTVQSVRFDLTLAGGQFLTIDTAARTALLNGLPQSNQRGRAVWDIDPYPLPPGTSTLRYLAGGFNATTTVTASWRSAWW